MWKGCPQEVVRSLSAEACKLGLISGELGILWEGTNGHKYGQGPGKASAKW